MKFGDKYELLESLTTGGVETFVANDKIRGERVLVHILHCDPQKPNQPTVQWVLESFRRVAPEPAALVLETGRYSGTLYAYLVSKLPDEAALNRWVNLYEALGQDTAEFPRPSGPPTPESEAPTGEVTSKEPARPPGPVTQLFQEFDLQAKADSRSSGAPKLPSNPAAESHGPLPNIRTPGEKSEVRAAPQWDQETPRNSAPPRTLPSGSGPSGPFRPDLGESSFPSQASSPPPNNGPKPGEFTSFFQGPFRGDRPLETPAISSPQERPRKSVGDFTAIFGPMKPEAEEPSPAPGIAGNEPAGTGFTGWFNPDASSQTSSTTAPPTPRGLPRAAEPMPLAPPLPKEPIVLPPPVSSVAPAPPAFPTPIPLIPPLPKPPSQMPSAMASDGATRAFARPNFETPASPPPAPIGPSAYTQVISVKAMRQPEDVAGAQKKPAATQSAFPAAPMPPLPAMTPPAAPAMPAISIPPRPKPPKTAVPEATVSYWPLILTLTVLFFIAVLLVLYFVLKH